MPFELESFPFTLPRTLINSNAPGTLVGKLQDKSEIRFAIVDRLLPVELSTEKKGTENDHIEWVRTSFEALIAVDPNSTTNTPRLMELSGIPARIYDAVTVVNVRGEDAHASKFYQNPDQLLLFDLRYAAQHIAAQVLVNKDGSPVAKGQRVQLVEAVVQEQSGNTTVKEMAILDGRRIVSVNGRSADDIQNEGDKLEGYKVVITKSLSRDDSRFYQRASTYRRPALPLVA